MLRGFCVSGYNPGKFSVEAHRLADYLMTCEKKTLLGNQGCLKFNPLNIRVQLPSKPVASDGVSLDLVDSLKSTMDGIRSMKDVRYVDDFLPGDRKSNPIPLWSVVEKNMNEQKQKEVKIQTNVGPCLGHEELPTALSTNNTILPTNNTILPTNNTVLSTNNTILPTNNTAMPTDKAVLTETLPLVNNDQTVPPCNSPPDSYSACHIM